MHLTPPIFHSVDWWRTWKTGESS